MSWLVADRIDEEWVRSDGSVQPWVNSPTELTDPDTGQAITDPDTSQVITDPDL